MNKKKNIAAIAVLLTAVFLLTSCRNNDDAPDISDTPLHDDTPIEHESFSFSNESFPDIGGSPSTAPLAQAITSVLLNQPQEDADTSGFTRTTQAYRDLAAGKRDIIISSEPTPDALDEISAQGINLEIAPIAIEALVFVVNASNPVDNLTSEQLREIYSGKTTNWQQLGGESLEIAAFQRNEEAASQVIIQKMVMDWQPMMDAQMQSFSAGFEEEEANSAIMGFDGSTGAIGYTLFYYADVMQLADGLRILSVDGVAPNNDTIRSGEYPLLNPYYAAIRAEEPQDSSVRIMYNWIKSEKGQETISRAGYVSLLESSQSDILPTADLRWNVSTDDSHLTTIQPPHSMHTRQSGGSLTEFQPLGSLGTILPYSSAITMNDGSLRISKYGLVSEDGTVLTDLIYDNIEMAIYQTANANNPRPAYNISMNNIDPGVYYGVLNAAFAVDGSWVTPLEYVDVIFSDEVIFMMKEYESFDIDVFDYNGKLLYNILEMEWAEEISEEIWAEIIVYGASEGYSFVKLNDETYGRMDIMTGELERTDFAQAFMYSEGLAAATPRNGNLWGFINKDLEFVIEPEFTFETVFVNGRAVVETLDGSQHIINAQGEKLFTIGSDSFMIMNFDGIGFSLHIRERWSVPTFYSDDFAEITYPEEATSLGAESSLQYIGDGWHYAMTEEGMWLISKDGAYLVSENRQIEVKYADGYFIYTEYDDNFETIGMGVMLPDGTDVIALRDVASITPAVKDGTVTAFIINTNISGGMFIQAEYTPAQYNVVGLDGTTIAYGFGVMDYNETLELFSVQGTDFFAWLDSQGNTLISIPFMGYSFD